MLNSTAPYRREGNGNLRVPVVMPLVLIQVDDTGNLDVRLDREPYSPDGSLHRSDLRPTIESIANDLGAPVRVEVREADGSTFTDIVAPGAPDHDPSPPNLKCSVPAEVPAFLPGEEVSVAVVVARQRGDATGDPRIPPALLAAHRGDVVLVGRTSGTVRVLGE